MKGITFLLAGLSVSAFALPHDVKIKVGNEAVAFDAAPRQVGGVTMVPLRTMMDAMQGSMRWDPQKGTISAWKNSSRFDIMLNNRQAMLNDKPVSLEQAPMIFKNRVYVPLKFVADASGYIMSQENGWFVLRPARKGS